MLSLSSWSPGPLTGETLPLSLMAGVHRTPDPLPQSGLAACAIQLQRLRLEMAVPVAHAQALAGRQLHS
jgi:hypothetical protein